MVLKCFAILAFTVAAANAAVVAPQQQTLPVTQNFGYFVPQPAQGYQQSYFYAPVALAPAAAAADASYIDAQQQQQQKQAVAFRAGDTFQVEPFQPASGRFFFPGLTPSSINALLAQAVNKNVDPILVKADLFRSNAAAGADPAGWALFYQKNSATNVQMFVSIQSTGTAATDAILVPAAGAWNDVRIRSAGALGAAPTRCAVANLGTATSTITMTSTARTLSLADNSNVLNAITGTASIPPATATLFGTSSIINKNVRFATTADVPQDSVNSFCGIINQVQ